MNSKAESQSQALCRKILFSNIQPMPQYETLFHLKMMANGKNLASGKAYNNWKRFVGNLHARQTVKLEIIV